MDHFLSPYFSEEEQRKGINHHTPEEEESGDEDHTLPSLSCTDSSSDSEGENDIQELLSTLQRVYNEVCSPPRSRPSTPGDRVEEKRGVAVTKGCGPILEGWADSDSESEEGEGDQSEEGEERRLGVFNKLEETRSTLEEVMGLQKLMEAYTVIQVCVAW